MPDVFASPAPALPVTVRQTSARLTSDPGNSALMGRVWHPVAVMLISETIQTFD
jgi:hypothetical protein